MDLRSGKYIYNRWIQAPSLTLAPSANMDHDDWGCYTMLSRVKDDSNPPCQDVGLTHAHGRT